MNHERPLPTSDEYVDEYVEGYSDGREVGIDAGFKSGYREGTKVAWHRLGYLMLAASFTGTILGISAIFFVIYLAHL